MNATNVTLTRAEHHFYTSGISRGHSEACATIADQLHAAWMKYARQVEAGKAKDGVDWSEVSDFLVGQFNAISTQLRETARTKQAAATKDLGLAVDASTKSKSNGAAARRDDSVPASMIAGSLEFNLDAGYNFAGVV